MRIFVGSIGKLPSMLLFLLFQSLLLVGASVQADDGRSIAVQVGGRLASIESDLRDSSNAFDCAMLELREAMNTNDKLTVCSALRNVLMISKGILPKDTKLDSVPGNPITEVGSYTCKVGIFRDAFFSWFNRTYWETSLNQSRTILSDNREYEYHGSLLRDLRETSRRVTLQDRRILNELEAVRAVDSYSQQCIR